MNDDDHTKNLLARIHGLQLANRFFAEQIEEIRKQMESQVVAKFVERRESGRRIRDRSKNFVPQEMQFLADIEAKGIERTGRVPSRQLLDRRVK